MSKDKKWYVAIPADKEENPVWPMVIWLLGLPQHLPGYCLDPCFGSPVDANRNAIVRRFLKSGADYLWMVDQDMDPFNPYSVNGGVDLVKEAMARDDVDILSGISFRIGESDNGPVPCVSGKDRDHVIETVFSQEPGLHEMEGIATGGACLVVKRHVLMDFLKRKTVWFKNHLNERDAHLFGSLELSEDLHFVRNAQEFGHRFWVDTRIQWGHLKRLDLRDELKRTKTLLEEAQP